MMLPLSEYIDLFAIGEDAGLSWYSFTWVDAQTPRFFLLFLCEMNVGDFLRQAQLFQ